MKKVSTRISVSKQVAKGVRINVSKKVPTNALLLLILLAVASV